MNKNGIITFVLLLLLTPLRQISAQEELPPIPPVPVIPELELSEEDEKELLNNLSAKLRKELSEIKKLNLNKYQYLLQESRFRSYDFLHWDHQNKERQERSKRIFELQMLTETMGIKYQNAGAGEKSKMKAELKQMLGELFDLKETERKNEVERLKKKLKELTESLQTRRNNKQEIVNRRLQDLLGESKYLRWN